MKKRKLTPQEEEEVEANVFAMELLMPEELVGRDHGAARRGDRDRDQSAGQAVPGEQAGDDSAAHRTRILGKWVMRYWLRVMWNYYVADCNWSTAKFGALPPEEQKRRGRAASDRRL